MMDFNESCGFEVIGFRNKQFVIEVDIREMHLNRYGFVHGGVLFTMLDTALSRVFLDQEPPSRSKGVTLEMKINYLKTAHPGDRLTAYGILTNKTRRTAFVEGHIENQNHELIAKASATMMRIE